MKNVKKLWKVASLFVGMLAILCSSTYAEETIKVGVVGPRTGDAAATGKAFEEGIELALDKINGSGGVLDKKMEVVFEDTAGDPAKAASGLEKLITKDNIVMAVGESHSSAALAEIDVANRYQTPLIIAEAWHDDVTGEGYKYVFRAGPANSGVVHENIIEFIKDYDFKKVAIVAENTDWGLGIKDLAEEGLKKAGIPFKTVLTERKGQDHYGELTKIMNFEPDLVLAFVYGFGVHYLISQANELGLFPDKALILEGAGPPSLWPEFWETVGDAGNLELFVSRMHPEVQFTEVTKEYQEAYMDKFGEAPSDYKSRSIYDTLLIAADAINRAGSKDPDKLVEALENTKLTVGSGEVEFGTTPGSYAYHQWQPPMLMIQWQDREQVVVYPKSVATGELKR